MSDLAAPVLDGDVSDAKIEVLLKIGCELPELDYKQLVDLTGTRGLVELAKDVGAMQVRGGYLVIGVDGTGTPDGGLDAVDPRLFDEAMLTPRLLKYLPSPLTLRVRLIERGGHQIAVLFVGPHPAGCAFFTRDGRYHDGKREVVVFRAGDVYWRDGTRSVRMSQQGFESVVQQRVARAQAERLAGNDEPSLARALEHLLAEGRRVRVSVTPSLDGSCALYEIWEHQLRTTLEDRGRRDLISELTADGPLDMLRGLWSDRLRVERRTDRILKKLAELVDRLKAAGPAAETRSVG